MPWLAADTSSRASRRAPMLPPLAASQIESRKHCCRPKNGHYTTWLRNRSEEVLRVIVPELREVLLDLSQCRIAHPGRRLIRSLEEAERATQCSTLRVERQID